MKRIRKIFLVVATLFGASHSLPASAIESSQPDPGNPILERIAKIQQQAQKHQSLRKYLEDQGLAQWANWPNWPNWNNWNDWPNWGNWYNY